MSLFNFEFGKKKGSANDVSTGGQWQGMADAVPFKNEVETQEKAQMERQQRKIIAGMLYDMKYMSEPDVFLPQNAKEDFETKVRAGEIDENVEKAFLAKIRTPVGAHGSEKVNDRLGNNLHFRRILGFAFFGSEGFKNYGTVMDAKTVSSFIKNYPTPVDFKNVSERMLSGIRRGSGEQKYQEYMQDIDEFQKIIYGKRYEYYKSFEDLRKKATEDMTIFFDNENMPTAGDNSVEKCSDSEKEKIMNKAVVDGEPFLLQGQKYQLDISILRELDLVPREKMMLEGVEIGLSGSFKVGSRDVVLGYVKTDDGYKVRSYYRSNSQGVWRYLPDYVTDGGNGDGILWYGKGYTEEMTTLPAEMQKTLSEIAMEEPVPVEQKTSPAFILAGTAKAYDSKAQYREAKERNALRGDVYQEIDRRPIVNFGVISQSKNVPESVEARGIYRPDFTQEKMEWISESSIYGRLTNRVYESLGGGIRYTMSEDSKGRVFVSNIETSGKITSAGVRKEWVSGGDIETPLYEYASQDGGYGDASDVRGARQQYRCMWKNYLLKMPIIKEYLEARKN